MIICRQWQVECISKEEFVSTDLWFFRPVNLLCTPQMNMDAQFPSGTVTFLFTDIEGSTRLSLQHPAEMPALLARHGQILREAMERNHGYVFQSSGDSFCAAFHSAQDALHAAVQAQRSLFTEPWSPAPIKVRMGIHTGEAQLQIDSQYRSYSSYTTLASTQRIMSAGHGGQILLSGATRELVRDAPPAGTGLIDLGVKHLKDLLRPEHLYQLNITGLPDAFPPLATLDFFPNNLPVQLTSFVGRENEIAELKQAIQAHRLVTLTGSGGTGKTRLSLQVAAELLASFDHGVWFIELAPLSDPDLIPRTIISTIGIGEQPNKAPLEILKEYLSEKSALIVLDNCEHLVTASAKLADALLNAAPHLKILASSREALGVKGELPYSVPPLSLPDMKHLPPVEQLSQYEAVRLFIDRALLVAPSFVVDRENAPYIAQICYRLDGIPLAVELAAARIRMLSVEQISARLDDRFRLLTGGARTALPHQQTLRALIDWSYDLLSDRERLLLQRLSVFAGGWTLEAAEEVCAGAEPEAHGLRRDDILELLGQLVNKSLVMVMEPSHSGEKRYRTLETVRQYGREKLLQAGEPGIVRQRHLAYFVQLAEQAEPELYRSNQAAWFNRLDDELDNLRTALEWALTGNAESGLHIAAILWRFWDARGYLGELQDRLEQLLERYPVVDGVHARALAVQAYCVFRQDNFQDAIRTAEQSLQMARTLSDRQLEAFSLAFLGLFTLLLRNMEQGKAHLQQCVVLYGDLGDKIGQADAIYWLSVNGVDKQDATEYARESLRLYRELGHLAGIARNLTTLALLTIWSGDFFSPAPWLDEALSIAHQIGDPTSECDALTILGMLVYWQGDYGRANTCYQEAILLSEKLGYRYRTLWAHVFQAYAIFRQGEVHLARQMFKECIQRTEKVGLMMAVVFAVEGMAGLHVSQGRLECALQLFAWTDAMREKIGDTRPAVETAAVEKELQVIRAKIAAPEYARRSAQGRSMTVEQAIALALEET
jgi:predicted ATPase/class 3 adenylate cyclase